MSRTVRKMQGYKYKDGKTPSELYICNCSYCMGVYKQKLIDKISKREMKKEIQEYSSIG